MSLAFQAIFARLREILQKHSKALFVMDDKPNRYRVEADAGPAVIKAWHGNRVKRPMMPVAWVQIKRTCVSYHLIGIYGKPELRDGMSNELRALMQGETCFNFKTKDEALFREIDGLTRKSIVAIRKDGFITKPKASDRALPKPSGSTV